MLGQHHGFPSPVGGAGELAAALRGAPVRGRGDPHRHARRGHRRPRRPGRRRRDGGRGAVRARRAVIADVSAPALYRGCCPPTRCPPGSSPTSNSSPGTRRWSRSTGRSPGRSRGGRRTLSEAGTVHLGADERGLVRWSADIETGTLPESPFLLFGQMTTTDPTRSPAGTESGVGLHPPPPRCRRRRRGRRPRRTDRGRWSRRTRPGFRDRMLHRVVQGRATCRTPTPNLVHGAVNGGTAQLFQQLVFRPVPGLGGPRRRSRTSTSAARPPTPAAGCTASAVSWPRGPRSASTAGAAGCAGASRPRRSTSSTDRPPRDGRIARVVPRVGRTA